MQPYRLAARSSAGADAGRIATADLQDIPPGLSQSLFDFVYGALPSLAQTRENIRDLERRLSDPASADEYANRINAYQEAGGFAAEAAVARTLSGLGYPPRDQDRSIQSLSGGELTRAGLARALSTPADLLVLDEPTNHLDIAAREWLESTLASHPAACVIQLASTSRSVVPIRRPHR